MNERVTWFTGHRKTSQWLLEQFASQVFLYEIYKRMTFSSPLQLKQLTWFLCSNDPTTVLIRWVLCWIPWWCNGPTTIICYNRCTTSCWKQKYIVTCPLALATRTWRSSCLQQIGFSPAAKKEENWTENWSSLLWCSRDRGMSGQTHYSRQIISVFKCKEVKEDWPSEKRALNPRWLPLESDLKRT